MLVVEFKEIGIVDRMRKFKLNINKKAITSASVENKEAVAIVITSDNDKTEIRFSGSKYNNTEKGYINWHTQQLKSGDNITITFDEDMSTSSTEE